MLKDYLNLPEYIEGIGNVYAVNVIEYEKFKELAQKYIVIDKRQLEIELKEEIKESSLEIILGKIECFNIANNDKILKYLDEETKDFYKNIKSKMQNFNIDEFLKLLAIVLKRDDIIYDDENKRFIIGNDIEDKFIDKNNFDKFKNVVMRQNLLFAPFYYEDKILQSILTTLREQRTASNEGEGSSLETMLQILSLKKGMNPKDFQDYSYYQAVSDFSRLRLIEDYEWVKGIQTSGFGGKDIEIPDIYKNINLNEHPEANMIKLNSSVYQNADKL